MHNSERIQRPRFRLSMRWNWTAVGALAAAATIIIAFVTHRAANLPPMLGSRLETSMKSQTVRVANDIELRVGPDTKIVRVNDRSIRLLQGSISASVIHGSGFLVLTKRIQVTDQGTRFQVGSGRKMDYVSVQEGSVFVKAARFRQRVKSRQVLTALYQAKPIVVSLADIGSQVANSGTLLSQRNKPFVPDTAGMLDWNEGLRRLAELFPNARITDEGTGGGGSNGSLRYWCSSAADSGLASGLRAHFTEVAQAMAGDRINTSGWEIPVGFAQGNADNSAVDKPEDVYYIRLVPKNGTVVWRLNGSRGGQVDYPLGYEVALDYDAPDFVIHGTAAYEDHWEQTLVLGAWPSRRKPALKLKMLGSPMPEAREMLAEATRLLSPPERKKVDLDVAYSDLLYLDPERKHRLLIAWNRQSASQLCRMSDNVRPFGAVVLAVLVTDTPLAEPRADPGVYLLRLVMSGSSRTPGLELIGSLGGSSDRHYLLKKSKIKTESGAGGAGSAESLPGYGTMQFRYAIWQKDEDTFPLRFQVIGRPDDRTTRKIIHKLSGGHESASWRSPTETWAEGLIRVRRP